MPSPFPNSNSDAYFIARVRREVADRPVTFKDSFTGDGLTGGATAGQTPWTLSRKPVINPSRENLQFGAGLLVTVNGVAQTIAYDSPNAPPGGTVNLITETGEMYFGTVPTAGQSILASYQAVRFSTDQVLDALKEGLDQLYPEVYQAQTDSSIALSPTTTEYNLPAILSDPRVVPLTVEVAPPSGIITYFDTGLWSTVGANGGILKMIQAWPPGSIVRLTFNQPYQALSDVEPQCMWLPVYYACANLLTLQETRRSRQADIASQVGEGASKPGDGAKVAEMWMNKYLAGKQQFAREEPVATTVKGRIVERLPYMRATGFSWSPFS
jgi:hypothetical protein